MSAYLAQNNDINECRAVTFQWVLIQEVGGQEVEAQPRGSKTLISLKIRQNTVYMYIVFSTQNYLNYRILNYVP